MSKVITLSIKEVLFIMEKLSTYYHVKSCREVLRLLSRKYYEQVQEKNEEV